MTLNQSSLSAFISIQPRNSLVTSCFAVNREAPKRLVIKHFGVSLVVPPVLLKLNFYQAYSIDLIANMLYINRF